MKDHLLLMVVYAAALSIFFGTLSKDTMKARKRQTAVIFGGLVGGALLAGWLMALIGG